MKKYQQTEDMVQDRKYWMTKIKAGPTQGVVKKGENVRKWISICILIHLLVSPYALVDSWHTYFLVVVMRSLFHFYCYCKCMHYLLVHINYHVVNVSAILT